jgi:hypothetical protein
MLCSLWTDQIWFNTECSQCLREWVSELLNIFKKILDFLIFLILYYVLEHWQDGKLLMIRLGCPRHQVWWVSNETVNDKTREDWIEICYCVLSQSNGNIFGSFIMDFIHSDDQCFECLYEIMIDRMKRCVSLSYFVLL